MHESPKLEAVTGKKKGGEPATHVGPQRFSDGLVPNAPPGPICAIVVVALAAAVPRGLIQ